MAESIITTISDMLNEEKWTRVGIESFSRKNFTQFDNFIAQAFQEKVVDELTEICDEHIEKTKNSVVALYFNGVIKYEQNKKNNLDLTNLIQLFRDNKRWAIVEFLSEKVLNFEENKKALKALTAVYKQTNRNNEFWRTKERIWKIDHTNYQLSMEIAVNYERNEKIDLAIYYYKNAVIRLISQFNKKDFEEIWTKLVELTPESLDFFYSVDAKLKHKSIDINLNEYFMMLLPNYIDKNQDTAIELLTKILNYNPSNSEAKDFLISALKEKYKNRSKLEDAIEESEIEDSDLPISELLEKFYKITYLDVNDKVFHRSWGIGQIIDFDDDVFTIDFTQKKDHDMDADMALKSLIRLDDEHLWIRAQTNADELKEMAKDNMEEFLTITLNSFGKEMPLKKLKANILSSGAVDEKKWNSWWTKARKMFKTNPKFGASPKLKNTYFLRDKPMTIEEDYLNRFEVEKDFTKKLKLFQDYLIHSNNYDSPESNKMLSYFKNIATKNKVNLEAQTIEAILFLHNFNKQAKSAFAQQVEISSREDFYASLESPSDVYSELTYTENKKTLLSLIRRYDKQWDRIYTNILKQEITPLHQKILDELTLNEKLDPVNEFISSILEHYRKDTSHLVWLAKLYFHQKSEDNLYEIDTTSLFTAMINSLIIIAKEIDNKNNVATNRKKEKTLKDLMFKEEHLGDYLSNSPHEQVSKLASILPLAFEVLNEDEKLQIINVLKDNHPDLIPETSDAESSGTKHHAFMVTKKGYDNKYIEYKHILDVEIPENSNDISLAVEKGDLSENAEYKAALEHQEQLKAKVSQLDKELKSAKIIESKDIYKDVVSFGMIVKLLNKTTNEEESLTILGEWETDPMQNIISYKSPIGNELLDKEVGEEFTFVLNDKKIEYKVLDINKSDLIN